MKTSALRLSPLLFRRELLAVLAFASVLLGYSWLGRMAAAENLKAAWWAFLFAVLGVSLAGGCALYFYQRMKHFKAALAENECAVEVLSEESRLNGEMAALSMNIMAQPLFEEIADLLITSARRLTRSEFGYLRLLDPQTGELQPVENSADVPFDFFLSEDALMRALQRLPILGQANGGSDVIVEARSIQFQGEQAAGFSFQQRFLIAPAVIHGKRVGVLALSTYERDYTRADEAAAERLAALLAAALVDKQSDERNHYLSMHDPLTGLLNRRSYEEDIERLMDEQTTPVSVFMCDLDGLKQVNDSFGHAAGDDLLRLTASLLRACFRTEDRIARVGGDEFAVLLPEVDSGRANIIYNRIQRRLEQYNAAHNSMPVHISIGMATTADEISLNNAISRADEAMYAQKRTHHSQQRAEVVFCDQRRRTPVRQAVLR